MPVSSVWMLGESNITVSGGVTLDGINQGDGSHLVGRTITLNNANWQETLVSDNDANFDDNDGNQVLSGTQTIDGVTYSSGTRVEAEYKLTLRDPATGQTWTVIGYNVNNSNPAFGTIEGLAFIGPPAGWPPVGIALQVVGAAEGPGGGGQAPTGYETYVTPPCFTAGTQILTERGHRPVEQLEPDDQLVTMDSGLVPVRIVLQTNVSNQRLTDDPSCCPVKIPAGSLGAGKPGRDIVVSPNHCFLIKGGACDLHFGSAEVLVPAKALAFGSTLLPHDCPDGVTYFHLVLDKHEIIFAEGAATESFLLGPCVFAGAPPHIQKSLRRQFPFLQDPQQNRWPIPARQIINPWEAALIAA